MRPRLLGGGMSIVLDRQKKAIIMNGFLDWEGIGKKKKKIVSGKTIIVHTHDTLNTAVQPTCLSVTEPRKPAADPTSHT